MLLSCDDNMPPVQIYFRLNFIFNGRFNISLGDVTIRAAGDNVRRDI